MTSTKIRPGIYILQSLKNGTYYIGSTTNAENRLEDHNSSKVTATRYLIPWALKFFQQTTTLKEAKQLEFKLKKLKSKIIIEKIIKNQKITIK